MGVFMADVGGVAPHYFHSERVDGGHVDTWGVSGRPVAQFDSRTRDLHVDIETIMALDPENRAPRTLRESAMDYLRAAVGLDEPRPFELRFEGDTRFRSPYEFSAHFSSLIAERLRRDESIAFGSFPPLEVRTPLGRTLVGRVYHTFVLGLDPAYFPKPSSNPHGGISTN
ncbi:MAG: hypothetical protein Q7S65_02625 [Nanoarchaeota archaeon]|nr:hypothetical protein [Nanoarchaeota archaeon]